MTRATHRALALGASAWSGAAAGVWAGDAAVTRLALVTALCAAGALAGRRVAWWLAAAAAAFATLAACTARAGVPRDAARATGRVAAIEDARRGTVIALEARGGGRTRVLVPRTGDPLLDAWPDGAVPGATVTLPLETEQGADRGTTRRAPAASTITVVRKAGLVRGLAALPWRAERAFRALARERLMRGPDDATGGLLLATVAGDARGLTDEPWRALRASGLAHVAVVSGFNVSIVALAAAFCAAPFGGPHHPKRRAVALAAAFVLLALLPADPPVRRAAFAVLVARGGHLFGRGAPPAASLGVAATALLMLDPALAHSASFALTVGATAALVFAAQAGGRRGVVLAFVAPALVTGPLLVALTGRTSPYSLLANVAALPAVLPTLAAGWLAVLVPSDLTGAGACLALARGCAAWILFVARQTAAWPGSGALAAPAGPAWLALHLGLVAAALVPARGRVRHVALALALVTSAWPFRVARPAVPLARGIEVLDAGQGQAVLLAGGGDPVLVDTGDDRARDGTRAVLEQLRRRGVRRLDAVVLTHADRDHSGGAAEILSAVDVGRLVLPEPALDAPPLAPAVVEAARRGIAVVSWSAGRRVALPGVAVDVVHPRAGTWGSDNDAGLVLRAAFDDGMRVLLPADIDEVVEGALARRGGLLPVDLLVAGHHGARTSTSRALLSRTRPRLVLASCGRENRHGHPHPDTLARIEAAGARFLDTARHGPLAVSRAGERRLIVTTDGVPRAVVPALPGVTPRSRRGGA